jgi:hypothetical protein
MTKCSRQNIITTLCGTNTLEAKEGHNDDDDNDTNIFYEGESMNKGTIWTITLCSYFGLQM